MVQVLWLPLLYSNHYFGLKNSTFALKPILEKRLPYSFHQVQTTTEQLKKIKKKENRLENNVKMIDITTMFTLFSWSNLLTL